MLLLPVVSALQFYFLDTTFSIGLFDYTLTIGKMGPMSHLFGWLFHLALFIGALFALHVQDQGRHRPVGNPLDQRLVQIAPAVPDLEATLLHFDLNLVELAVPSLPCRVTE